MKTPKSNNGGSLDRTVRAAVKWTDVQGLYALIDAWAGRPVTCPTCGGACDLYGDVLNTKIWCPQCKTGSQSVAGSIIAA